MDKFIYMGSAVAKGHIWYGKVVRCVIRSGEYMTIETLEEPKRCLKTHKDYLIPFTEGHVYFKDGSLSNSAFRELTSEWRRPRVPELPALNDEHTSILALPKDLNDIKTAGTYAAGQEVNQPDHYAVGGIDPWAYAQLKFSYEANMGFHIINTLKYITRYEHKNGLEDLIKARDSINEAIKIMTEKKQPQTTSDVLEADGKWWRQQALEQEVSSTLERVIRDCEYPTDWREPTMELMRSISGCDPDYKQEKMSSARGLFGFLDSTRKTYGTEISDCSAPYIQISCGLQYIKDRYGDPHKALEFLNKNGWL